MSAAARLQKFLCGISPSQATFAERGFAKTGPAVQARLERVGTAFIDGYNTALGATKPDAIEKQLAAIEPDLLGFAYEGAAMALALLDGLTPWNRSRVAEFLSGAGGKHAYMVHVGIGWAAARLPWLRGRIEPFMERFDPLLRWLVIDGFGFHEGYFHGKQSFAAGSQSGRLSPYGRRVFDQGLGRSLWFYAGADVSRIETVIGNLASERQPDLWSGIGLACAYAGGISADELTTLRDASRPFQAQLAQGAAFAAKARQRAGNPAEHTERACQALCFMPAQMAAAVTDECLDSLPSDDRVVAYEHWRRLIQSRFAATDGATKLVQAPGI